MPRDETAATRRPNGTEATMSEFDKFKDDAEQYAQQQGGQDPGDTDQQQQGY
jgi:hypothetical protein